MAYVKKNGKYVRLNAIIHKSIKMDQHSYDVVMGAEGKDFSKKLRNIIEFYDKHKEQ